MLSWVFETFAGGQKDPPGDEAACEEAATPRLPPPPQVRHVERVSEVEPGVWPLDNYSAVITDVTSRFAMYVRSRLFALGNSDEMARLHTRITSRFDPLVNAHLEAMREIFPKDHVTSFSVDHECSPTHILLYTSEDLDRFAFNTLQYMVSECESVLEAQEFVERMRGIEDVRSLAMWRVQGDTFEPPPQGESRTLTIVPTELYDAYRLACQGCMHTTHLLRLWDHYEYETPGLKHLGIGSLNTLLSRCRTRHDNMLVAIRNVLRLLNPTARPDLEHDVAEAVHRLAAETSNYEKVLGLLEQANLQRRPSAAHR